MFSASEFAEEMFHLHCVIPLLRVFVMAGLWSVNFRDFADEEEICGEMNLVGPGGSSGNGVGEATSMFGPGRSSSFGQLDEDMNNDGLGQAITPFCGREMQGRLSPNRPISVIGNTRPMGHSDDLTMKEGRRQTSGERREEGQKMGRGGESGRKME